MHIAHTVYPYLYTLHMPYPAIMVSSLTHSGSLALVLTVTHTHYYSLLLILVLTVSHYDSCSCRPYPAIKVNRIYKNIFTAVGTRICLVLRSPCGSLAELCGGSTACQYAIFNDPSTNVNKCCPVRRWPLT